MALTINTNISSMNAQRNLNKTQSRLSMAIERLGTGKRINSARDDAAGLAISTRFTTQINGLNQAVRNADNGVKLAQTSESALDEATNNLQRIRELALQSINGNNSPDDRKAIDAEVTKRIAEITRIATHTNFNGMKVLDGSANELTFQVGANVGEVITINLNKGMKANQIGQLASGSVDLATKFGATSPGTVTSTDTATVIANFDYTATPTTFAINGKTVTLDADYTDAAGLATEINTRLAAANAGVTVSQVGGKFTFTNTAVGPASIAFDTAATTFFGAATETPGTDPVAAAPLVLAAGELSLSAGGRKLDIVGTFKSVQDVADAINGQSGAAIKASVAADGKLAFTSSHNIDVVDAQGLGFAASYSVDPSMTLADASVLTADAANRTIAQVDASLAAISALRSDLGAMQSRFESTMENLRNISENLSASRSAIRDADIAEEMAESTNAQILQQAGVSVLAQANASQQIVLKLLQ